ncbi:MAG: aldose 1-epimerase family protein [Syntrophothermus sp.]
MLDFPQPSGEQFEIAHGEQRATIVEVGGGVREYAVGGRPVLDPYPREAICDGAHGAPLIPWPNRLADGRYSFDGVEHRVALTEPEKQNAIHGFLRWRSWRARERDPRRVEMHTRLHPLEGFPFTLDVSVAYELSADGLMVTTAATNLSPTACPFAAGQHPYLSPGSGLIDDCTLELDAATRIETDEERQLPTGTAPVAGTEFDFRSPRRLGEQAIDFAFTDLGRDHAGRAWVRLTGPDSRSAELWVDEAYPIVELYTGDTLAPERRRRGLGSEPMTAPPNAFQTGERLIRLEPGETATMRWGARLA